MNETIANYAYRILTHRELGGQLIWRLGPGETCEIVDIEVPNENRRKGVGRKMVYDLVNKVSACDNRPALAKVVYVITRDENSIACQFYLGCGFRISGVLNNFYSDGSAVCFVRDVK